ncbi:MAG: hypothetical protein ACJAZ2_001371 [Glaciecola sp.]|jgi:hypothetical protein
MILRILSVLVVFLLTVGCNTGVQEPNNGIHMGILLDKVKSVELTEQHIGFWVNEDYIELLKQSKSTKIAGSKSADDFYRIKSDNSIMQMNIHEGAGLNVLSLKTKGSGAIYSSDSTRLIAEVSFDGDTLTVNDNRYFHIQNGDSALDKLVNECVVSGQYFLKESPVEFKSNGSITGMEGVQSYRLNLDYGAPGMEFDIIYLQMDSQPLPTEYLYDIEQDSVFIFDVDCQYEESGECMEVAKGSILFSFCKNSTSISEQQIDTLKIYSYFSRDSSKVQSIKYLWNLDTVFVQDTITKELYPAPEESGEIHYFDEGGSLIKNENLELTLPQNHVVVGRTSDSD